MTTDPDPAVRLGNPADARAIGQLLHDFNSEFGEPTPGPRALAERVAELLAGQHITVLVGGMGPEGVAIPDGLAILRFRPAIWTAALECYLAELYVVPQRRGQGLGRALMDAAIVIAQHKGADYMEVGTSEEDGAARALYESLGFSNRGGRPNGPITFFYEREL